VLDIEYHTYGKRFASADRFAISKLRSYSNRT